MHFLQRVGMYLQVLLRTMHVQVCTLDRCCEHQRTHLLHALYRMCMCDRCRYIYIYMCIGICVYIYVYLHVCAYVYLYVSMYVCMCMCMYMYIYICVCMYPRRCKTSSVGQSAGLLIPRSSVRFRQKLKKQTTQISFSIGE